MSQFLTSGGQSTGASASVLPVNIQDRFPLGWPGWVSLWLTSFTVHVHHIFFIQYLLMDIRLFHVLAIEHRSACLFEL